jgi:hypothetical protein
MIAQQRPIPNPPQWCFGAIRKNVFDKGIAVFCWHNKSAFYQAFLVFRGVHLKKMLPFFSAVHPDLVAS